MAVQNIQQAPLTPQNEVALLGNGKGLRLSEAALTSDAAGEIAGAMWPHLKKGDGPFVGEIAALMSKSQHENAMIILNGWAESIAVQSEKDKEADKRRQVSAADLKVAARSRQVLAIVVNKLEQSGTINEVEAGSLRATAKLPVVAEKGSEPLIANLSPQGTIGALHMPIFNRRAFDPRA